MLYYAFYCIDHISYIYKYVVNNYYYSDKVNIGVNALMYKDFNGTHSGWQPIEQYLEYSYS